MVVEHVSMDGSQKVSCMYAIYNYLLKAHHFIKPNIICIGRIYFYAYLLCRALLVVKHKKEKQNIKLYQLNKLTVLALSLEYEFTNMLCSNLTDGLKTSNAISFTLQLIFCFSFLYVTKTSGVGPRSSYTYLGILSFMN